MSEPFAAIKLCIDALDPTTDPVRSDLIDLNRARAELKAARELLAAARSFDVKQKRVCLSCGKPNCERCVLIEAIAACQPKEGV